MMKPGLANSEGWMDWPLLDDEPAHRAVFFDALRQREHDHGQAGEKEEQPGAADLLRVEHGGGDQQEHRRDHEDELPPEEIKRFGADLVRRRRARRERDEGAEDHDDEHRAQQRAIHREPPFGHDAAIGARQSHAALVSRKATPSSEATMARKASPLAIKFGNWS